MRGAAVAVLGPVLVGDAQRRLAQDDRVVLCWLITRRGLPTNADWLACRLRATDPVMSTTDRVTAAIARLRRVGIGVHEHPLGWLLSSIVAVDADRFTELIAQARAQIAGGGLTAASGDLAAALPLWRGAPYPDLARHPDASSEIERLTAVWLDGLEAHNHLTLRSAIDFRFVASLRALAVSHPYRVTLHHQLAIALARVGSHAQAMDVLDDLLVRYRRAGNDVLGRTIDLRRSLRTPESVWYDDPQSYLCPRGRAPGPRT